MSDQGSKNIGDLSFDAANLYREEMFTDLKMGTLRRLTPVNVDGTTDEARTPLFSGETHLMSQGGPIPVQAAIEANTLKEAMEAFPAAMQTAVEQMIEEAREAQRREASRIVVPGQDKAGKIQLP